MNNAKQLITAIASASLLAQSALSQGVLSEISVQGRSDDGGSQTAIVGTARSVRFSLTGRRGDLAGVLLKGKQSPLFEKTIQDIINGNARPLILDGPITTLPDGRTRIFVIIAKPDVAVFRDCRVRLRSGNVLLDEDPVLFR